MRGKITVIVPCYNNQDIIRECLESVKWADEIIVCDSYSKDATVEIAREYTGRIIQHEYINSAVQKNWAIPQAANEWVMIVDSDERVTAQLRGEIENLLDGVPSNDGYKIPRANFSFGKQLKYGGYWPDYQLRLFKKNKGRYEPRYVHAHVELDGNCGFLKNHLLHFHDRTLFQVTEKMLFRYARWEAMERLNKKEPRLWELFLKPPGVFVYRFFYQRGFKDGLGGFFAASLWAAYIFMTYWNMFRLRKAIRP